MTLFERLEEIKNTSKPYKNSKYSYRIASPEEAAIYQQLWDGMVKDSNRIKETPKNDESAERKSGKRASRA